MLGDHTHLAPLSEFRAVTMVKLLVPLPGEAGTCEEEVENYYIEDCMMYRSHSQSRTCIQNTTHSEDTFLPICEYLKHPVNISYGLSIIPYHRQDYALLKYSDLLLCK